MTAGGIQRDPDAPRASATQVVEADGRVAAIVARDSRDWSAIVAGRQRTRIGRNA